MSPAVIIILGRDRGPEFFFDAGSDRELAELREGLQRESEVLKKWLGEILGGRPLDLIGSYPSLPATFGVANGTDKLS